VLLAALALGACRESEQSPVKRAPVPPAVPQPSAADSERAPSWATEVGKSLAQGMQLGAANRVAPATMPDRFYDSAEPVAVRRLVYRVSIDLPQALRATRPPAISSSSELHLDVGIDRLRARFVGPGWPVDDGSEVRMRVDIPGAYVFDSAGGRPLGPGHLASWFAGDDGEQTNRQPVQLRREPGPSSEGPSELVCAFIAEWTAHSRQSLEQWCADGVLVQGFRFGLWVADLTAIVPMTLPRSQLRADSMSLPRPFASARARSLLEPRDIGRIVPTVVKSSTGVVTPVDAGPPGSGVLRARNHARARMLVVVQGVPLGWLQPGAAAEFNGFTPGYYRVGSARPFAQYSANANPLLIPGDLSIGLAAESATIPTDAPDLVR
jgi:hypothetical protein